MCRGLGGFWPKVQERCEVLSQEQCREDQKFFRSGIPRPPNLFGVKMILLEYWGLLPLMNLMKIFSISAIIWEWEGSCQVSEL